MNIAKQPANDFQTDHSLQSNQNNQSAYCDYNKAFVGYDQFRQPHGLDRILNILQQSDVPINEQSVLEGGFGTGAYLNTIRRHVRMIYGVEGSDEGYQQTLLKVNNAPNVRLQKGDILQLCLPDSSLHAYVVNQVLHHLDHGNYFQSINVFLSEAARVLKPGGQLIINTCSRDQLDPDSGSYWHYKYIYPAAYSVQKRYIPIQELEIRLNSSGFNEFNCTFSPEKIFCQRYYEDPAIALDPEFSKADSTYSFLSEDELEKSYRRLRQAIEDETVYEVMKRAAKRAAEIGEAVIISTRKS